MDSEENSASARTTESPPEPSGGLGRIGPYRILQLLGEGGMGVVYLAEQEAPVRRRVALKLIKPGMDSRQVLARFESERQALAILNHPHVAKVFDAGATEDGRPYFVMEHVPGVPITVYCDTRRLGLPERLALFMQTCEAIQHAHQKGILHRDVKPSNVLVADQDGKPLVKVIDFGVAKATSQKLTERTLFTQQGLLIGTPEYMSPEQAGTTALDVDSRTDIYSLGVLLYELLVGSLPFDPATLRKAAMREMLRIIQEDEPPKPTTRIGSLGDTAQEIARRRHTDLRSLVRQLRGDLEWITMRALEKDPGRRYPSASELAADIRRHLEDEPVTAGPPSAAYRLRKLVRRHRAPAAAGMAVVAALLLGFIVSSIFYLRARAEALRVRLDAAAVQSALLDDLQGYLSRSKDALMLHRRGAAQDRTSLASHLVARLAFLELFGQDQDLPEDLPIHEMEAEALRLVYEALNRGDTSVLETADLLAEFLQEDRPEVIERLHRATLTLRRKTSPEGDPHLVRNLENLAKALERRAAGMMREQQAAEAQPFYREAFGLWMEAQPILGPFVHVQSFPPEFHGSVVEMQERALDDLHRALADGRTDVLEVADTLAELLAERSAGEAERLRREILILRRKTLPKEDARLNEGLRKLVELLERRAAGVATRDPSAAASVYREALELWREGFPEQSEHGAVLEEELGASLVRLKRFAEAEPLLLRSHQFFSTQLGDNSATTQQALARLIDLYRAWGRPDKGEAHSIRRVSPAVERVRDLGPLCFADVKAGRPIGYSARWGDRSVWVFGNTRFGWPAEDGAWVRSSTRCWTRDLDARDGLAPFEEPIDGREAPVDLLPFTASEKAFNRLRGRARCQLVPGPVVTNAAERRALLFYRKAFGEPFLDLRKAGTSIAIWDNPEQEPTRPVLRPGTEDSTILFPAPEPPLGSGALVVEDRLYAYGCECPDLECSCALGVAPIADVLEREAWRFYSGAGFWSADWHNAVSVISCTPELSVHWNSRLGKYLAVCSQLLDKNLLVRIADRPEGPWSDPPLIVEGLASTTSWTWAQSAVGHPDLARERGRMEYLTYWRALKEAPGSETRLIELTFR